VANKKITQLEEVNNPAASDIVPVVSGGATKKVTLANLVKAALAALGMSEAEVANLGSVTATAAELNALHGVKRYVARLMKEGEDPLTVTVLENTLGTEVLLDPQGPGAWNIYTLTEVFPHGKTIPGLFNSSYDGNPVLQYLGPQTLYFQNRTLAGVASDAPIIDSFIVVTVYP
jgi:hypothetical protein